MKILLIILIIAQNYFCIAQEIKDIVEDKLKSNFGNELNFEIQKYVIAPELKNKIQYEAKQKFYSDYVFVYKIYNKDELKGFAILDNVLGKEQPITFIVMIDTSGTIIATEIVKYREPYGGSVQNESWNDQFKGNDSNSKLKVGEDIDGISGATISVYSVTKGIKKIILLFDSIKNEI